MSADRWSKSRARATAPSFAPSVSSPTRVESRPGKGLLSRGGEWANPEDITVRQDGATWGVELHTYQADWGLCTLRVRGDFSKPVIRWRRSNTLFMGERLLYAVAGVGQEGPRLAWAQLTDVFAMKEKYNRPYIWTADLDPSMPLEYAFAFDSDGRVAGLLEPLPDLGPKAALLAGEWVGGLVERCWVESLGELGALEQLVSEYRDDPDSYEAESLCGIGMALDVLGDKEGARQAFVRASVKDPLESLAAHRRSPVCLRQTAPRTLNGVYGVPRNWKARSPKPRARRLQRVESADGWRRRHRPVDEVIWKMRFRQR